MFEQITLARMVSLYLAVTLNKDKSHLSSNPRVVMQVADEFMEYIAKPYHTK